MTDASHTTAIFEYSDVWEAARSVFGKLLLLAPKTQLNL